MSVERAGDDLFQTTVADDRVLLLDRQTLETLPQGRAKLATLLFRERVLMREERRNREPEADEALPGQQAEHLPGSTQH